MNELYIAHRVRQHLNQGLNRLRPDTVIRLAEARQRALAVQKQAETRTLLATVGYVFQHQFDHLGYRQLFAGTAIMIAIACSTFWVADQQVNELKAIDTALLTSELPISAFTDKGFDAWLKRNSSL